MSALTPARYQPVSLDGASLTLAGLASIVAGAPALVDPSALASRTPGPGGRRPGHRRAARLRADDGGRRRPRGDHQRAGRPRPAAAAGPRRRVGRAAARGRRALRPGHPRQPAARRRVGRHARPRRRAGRDGLRPGRPTCRSSTGTAAWAPATSRPARRSVWRCSASGPAPTGAAAAAAAHLGRRPAADVEQRVHPGPGRARRAGAAGAGGAADHGGLAHLARPAGQPRVGGPGGRSARPPSPGPRGSPARCAG